MFLLSLFIAFFLQDLIFAPTPKGKRKVVISTNIAETSLTLDVMLMLYLYYFEAGLVS